MITTIRKVVHDPMDVYDPSSSYFRPHEVREWVAVAWAHAWNDTTNMLHASKFLRQYSYDPFIVDHLATGLARELDYLSRPNAYRSQIKTSLLISWAKMLLTDPYRPHLDDATVSALTVHIVTENL